MVSAGRHRRGGAVKATNTDECLMVEDKPSQDLQAETSRCQQVGQRQSVSWDMWDPLILSLCPLWQVTSLSRAVVVSS